MAYLLALVQHHIEAIHPSSLSTLELKKLRAALLESHCFEQIFKHKFIDVA